MFIARLMVLMLWGLLLSHAVTSGSLIVNALLRVQTLNVSPQICGRSWRIKPPES
jgi:hypothetical protein